MDNLEIQQPEIAKLNVLVSLQLELQIIMVILQLVFIFV